MPDAPELPHLPDLPVAGYATRREKELTDEVMHFIRNTERDRLLLLDIVCNGKEKFRGVARKAWSHLKVDTELCDAVFGYLVLLAGAYPEMQRDSLLRLSHLTPIQKVLKDTERYRTLPMRELRIVKHRR